MENKVAKNKNLDKQEETQNGKLIISLSRALQHIHQKSEQLFYQNDLTMSQFMVLEALYHKGDLPIKDIINTVLSSSGNITVVVKNLEKRGLVYRFENPQDKRSFVIQITQAGKNLLLPIYSRHMEFVATAVSRVSVEEKSLIISILKKLTGKQKEQL